MPKMDPKGAAALKKQFAGDPNTGILSKVRKALGMGGDEEDTQPKQEDVGNPEVRKEKTRNLLNKLRDRGSNIQPSSMNEEEEELKRQLEEELASPARMRRPSSLRGEPVE